MKKLLFVVPILFIVGCGNQVTELPELITINPIITDSTFVLKGEVTNTSGDSKTKRGICWSTSPNPSTEDFVFTDSVYGLGVMTIDITSKVNTTKALYVRAFAQNSFGKKYGNEIVVRTEDFKEDLSSEGQVGRFVPVEMGKKMDYLTILDTKTGILYYNEFIDQLVDRNVNKKGGVFYVLDDEIITYRVAIESAEWFGLDVESWAKRHGWSKVDINEMKSWRKLVQFRSSH